MVPYVVKNNAKHDYLQGIVDKYLSDPKSLNAIAHNVVYKEIETETRSFIWKLENEMEDINDDPNAS